MSDNANADIVKQEIVYDGEQYDRDGLSKLIDTYNTKHQSDLSKLSELRQAHDDIAAEMTKDLVEAKTAWEYVHGMVSDDLGSNFRGLLEKIPILCDLVPDRPLNELLREKVEVAEKRTKQVGQFLTTIERSVLQLQDDVVRLNKKVVVAAENEERAARHVLALKEVMATLEAELAALEPGSADYRRKEAELEQVKSVMWQHGAKLRLFSNAEDRIASIVKMNNNFLEILTNLHANMQTLHDAGMEVLDELRGNLSGLATAAEASELSVEMQESMQSLKKSVNKVAVLASDTALFLTQNVDRLTSEMKIYDEATESLIESNLAAEREVREQRINETIALAEKEYGLMQAARQDVGE
jgi:hypothetical protein